MSLDQIHVVKVRFFLIFSFKYLFVFFSQDNCGDSCVFWTENFLDWSKPGIGRFVTFMAIQSVISFSLLLLIDYRIISRVWNFIRSIWQPEGRRLYQNGYDNGAATGMTRQVSNINHEDDDVIGEEERIRTSPNHVLMETDVLVLNQVEKVYQGSFHAVDQISIGVKQRECFGLLGVNGA